MDPIYTRPPEIAMAIHRAGDKPVMTFAKAGDTATFPFTIGKGQFVAKIERVEDAEEE